MNGFLTYSFGFGGRLASSDEGVCKLARNLRVLKASAEGFRLYLTIGHILSDPHTGLISLLQVITVELVHQSTEQAAPTTGQAAPTTGQAVSSIKNHRRGNRPNVRVCGVGYPRYGTVILVTTYYLLMYNDSLHEPFVHLVKTLSTLDLVIQCTLCVQMCLGY